MPVLEVERAHREHLVAVDDAALLVDRDHAVGIAVEGEPRVGPVVEHGRL